MAIVCSPWPQKISEMFKWSNMRIMDSHDKPFSFTLLWTLYDSAKFPEGWHLKLKSIKTSRTKQTGPLTLTTHYWSTKIKVIKIKTQVSTMK